MKDYHIYKNERKDTWTIIISDRIRLHFDSRKDCFDFLSTLID